MLIINQIFLAIINTPCPEEVVQEVVKYLPDKEQVKRKGGMHQDLWLFKGHRAEDSFTSYYTYSEEMTKNGSRMYNSDECEREIYYDPYNDRRSHSIFSEDFLTWKEMTYSDWYRGAYEELLFDVDGEETNSFRILYPTEDYIDELSNDKGMFLRKAIIDQSYNEYPIGIVVLNIISKALDGVYTIEWETSGFSGDDTGEYEGDYISIYNKSLDNLRPVQQASRRRDCDKFKEFFNDQYQRWSQDPGGRYTGLIIGVSDTSDFMEQTVLGEKFFSIYLKPDSADIMGGYWGYERDRRETNENGITNIIPGPRIAASRWNNFRSQNEIDETE